MTEEQLALIVGLVNGLETCLVHFANVLDHKGVIAKQELASSLRETAKGVPAGIQNHRAITMVLEHVASGIEQASMDGQRQTELSRLLH